jgi:hypothetical protein
VIFNFIAIMILALLFRSAKCNRTSLVFLLTIGQSVFLLISARIAWEVNSFTLFFIALLLLAVWMTQISNKLFIQNGGYSLFFITNLLGTYNHVIFSCISIAGLLGLILWSLHNRSFQYKNLILLCLINAVNLALLFCGMQSGLDKLIPLVGYTILLVLAIILLELYVLRFLISIIPNNFVFKISPVVTISLFIIFFNCFVYFHGVAFFQLVTNTKVLLHFFSQESNPFQTILYIVSGCSYLIVLCVFLIQDVYESENAIFAWIITSYFGLFSFYTTNCSFRYYLSIFILSSIYIAIKFNQQPKRLYIFCAITAMTTISINKQLFNVFNSDNKIIRPVYFNMGNGQMETSAHFLPNKPVIDFLKKSKAQKITYSSNQYFLEQPINFYYKIAPWPRSANKSAIIDYDFENIGNGYQLYSN